MIIYELFFFLGEKDVVNHLYIGDASLCICLNGERKISSLLDKKVYFQALFVLISFSCLHGNVYSLRTHVWISRILTSLWIGD